MPAGKHTIPSPALSARHKASQFRRNLARAQGCIHIGDQSGAHYYIYQNMARIKDWGKDTDTNWQTYLTAENVAHWMHLKNWLDYDLKPTQPRT